MVCCIKLYRLFVAWVAVAHSQETERDLHRWLQCLFEFTLRPYTVWMELQETQLS